MNKISYESPFVEVLELILDQRILEGSPTDNDNNNNIDNPGIGGPGEIVFE